jgi:cysteine desulfurase
LQKPIYMDYSATTPVDPRVLDAMLPYFRERFGNAASRHHAWGWEAEEATEIARERVAAAIGAKPREVVFTSGATESNNLALKGVAEIFGPRAGQIITTPIEHKSVLDVCEELSERGYDVVFLPVDAGGRVEDEALVRLLEKPTVLVSVMHGNNETGVLQPVEEIGSLCKEHGVFFHVDATQSVGKVALDVNALGADLLSLSGHKVYGPKGVGALYTRKRKPRVRLQPLLAGGGHEGGARSGTLNVPGIVGLGEACRLAVEGMEEEGRRVRELRDRLEHGITTRLSGTHVHGAGAPRLPNILNVSFAGLTGESLLGGLRRLAVSTGSACTSGSLEPSYVLRAMGLSDELARSSVRFSLGRFSTAEEVELAIEEVVGVVSRLRGQSAAAPRVEHPAS